MTQELDRLKRRTPALHGFDEHYFVQQVAGLTQMTGEFMRVKPIVIDLGWGDLKTALVRRRAGRD